MTERLPADEIAENQPVSTNAPAGATRTNVPVGPPHVLSGDFGRHQTASGRRPTVRRTGQRPAGDGPYDTTPLPVVGRFGSTATRWESRYRWAVIGSDLLACLLAVVFVGSFVA